MKWISEHDPIEEHDLNIDVDLLYMDYIRFIEENEHVTDDARNIDFNAVCVNRIPGDPNSVTSQFFINHKDNGFLNHTGENPQGWGYAVFGAVTEGMDVVDQIADVATGNVGPYQDVPLEVITIESVTISE